MSLDLIQDLVKNLKFFGKCVKMFKAAFWNKLKILAKLIRERAFYCYC